MNDRLSRLTHLQREEMALRQLVEGPLAEHTRGDIEELLRLIREQIEHEKQLMADNETDNMPDPSPAE